MDIDIWMYGYVDMGPMGGRPSVREAVRPKPRVIKIRTKSVRSVRFGVRETLIHALGVSFAMLWAGYGFLDIWWIC